ncbi:hypothetical protein SDC9_201540 [bioreactor metagenome]|uniref:Uncharacterized protein n=1 Tax=bioreactor metagenome TaxID=1076179 RepID=A0A645ISS9_9ZZZZ
MHPIAGKGLARGRFALGDFVFVMGEDQILAAGVNIEGGAQKLHAHGAAFDMPARPAHSPGGGPSGFAGFGAFP